MSELYKFWCKKSIRILLLLLVIPLLFGVGYFFDLSYMIEDGEMADNVLAYCAQMQLLIKNIYFLAVILLILNKALREFDPYSEPKGLVLLALTAVEMVDNSVKADVNDEIFDYLGPYVGYLWGYIFLSSISGLFGNQAVPTGNFSVTLTLAIITITMVEVNSIKYNGIKNYVKGLFEPMFRSRYVPCNGKSC